MHYFPQILKSELVFSGALKGLVLMFGCSLHRGCTCLHQCGTRMCAPVCKCAPGPTRFSLWGHRLACFSLFSLSSQRYNWNPQKAKCSNWEIEEVLNAGNSRRGQSWSCQGAESLRQTNPPSWFWWPPALPDGPCCLSRLCWTFFPTSGDLWQLFYHCLAALARQSTIDWPVQTMQRQRLKALALASQI